MDLNPDFKSIDFKSFPTLHPTMKENCNSKKTMEGVCTE